MIEIEKPKVDIVELSEDYRYGKFVIEPLERGYGITIGNAFTYYIIHDKSVLFSIFLPL